MAEHRSTAVAVADRTLRTFGLSQRIRYGYCEAVTDLHQTLKIVPPTVHGGQRRLHWDLEVTGVEASSTRVRLDGFGNLTLDIAVPRVDEAVEFELRVEAETDWFDVTHETAVDRRYLRRTRLTAPNAVIAELAPRPGDTDMAALCSRVRRSLDYEWGVTGVDTTAAGALAEGRGVCQDYAHIMLAACRAAGIPARYVSGHLTGEGGSHAWVEVLRPHPGRSDTWIAEGWDPTHDRRTDADYLVVAVGRDYADVAPLSGTFEGDGVASTLAVKKHLELS